MRRALALSLCLVPLSALAQQDDRGYLTRLLEDNLSGAGRSVRIEGFQGALSSRARIAALTIADDAGVWLTLTDVALDWNRGALLSGRVDVTSLTAGEIVLERLPQTDATGLPSPEASPFALPDLPVSVKLGQVQAGRIRLGPAILGTPAEARLDGAADLAGGEGSARLALERIDGIAGALRLDGSFANATRRLKLDLSLEEPKGGIAAGLIGLPGDPAINLNISGEGPIDNFEAVVALASDGQDRLFGSVGLTQSGDGARSFTADLKGDVTPLFLPDYRAFFGPDAELFARGRQSADGLMELEALRIRAAALRVDGKARIAADGLPQMLDLSLDLGDDTAVPVVLPISGDPVAVGAAHLRLNFDAAQGGDDWRLSGVVQRLETAALQADRLDLTGGGVITRADGDKPTANGTVSFAGIGLALADPALARVLGTELTGEARFDWAEGAPLNLPVLRLDGAGYGAEGGVTVTGPVTALTIDGRISARMDDLALVSGLAGRDLAGAGRVTWQGKVVPLSGAFDGVVSVEGRDIRVGQAEADALLRGQSTIRLDGARGPDGTEIRSLDVAAQSLTMAARGWLRSTGPDLRADLSFADLSVLGAGRGGELAVTAHLRGAALDNDLHLTVTGNGTNLRPGLAQADGLLRGKTSFAARAHWLDQVLRLDQADLAGSDWSVGATGRLADAARDLSVAFRLDDLRRLGAGYGGGLRGNLAYALAGGRETADLSATATRLTIGQPQVDSLLRGSSRLAAKASREGTTIRLEGLQLDTPQLTARANASEIGAQRRIDLNARLGDLALLVPGVPGPLTVSGRVDELNSRLTLDLTAQGPGGIAAKVAGTAAVDFATTALAITGTADAALANAFLGPVAVRGPVRFDLGLNGRPSLAALSGQVSLSDGRLTLADPPFAFRGVGASVALSGGRAQISAQARSDAGGTVAVSGPVALTAPFSGDLQITLDGVVLRDPSLYSTRASGALTVSGPLTGGARIAGRIALADTELRIPSSGLGSIAAIPDLRHIGEPAAVRRTRARAGLLEAANGRGGAAGGKRAYGLDISISAPNRVFIRGRGLDAELGGDFRIAGTTAKVVPSGGLQLIRGRLDLLGKRFAFTEGQLQTEGSLVPTVRLVATTDTVDGSASVIIEGPADAPIIRFQSQPELPEEEVVARLLFGRGLTTLTPIQAAQLASAVATLTGKGGSGVVDRLRKSFGLDDFDISAGANGGAAVRAGKYLSENVYVDLKLDSQGKSEVSINLDLSPSVTVRGRAGGDGGTGIGIHYERDY